MTIPTSAGLEAAALEAAKKLRSKLCIDCECAFDRGCGCCLNAIAEALAARSAPEAGKEVDDDPVCTDCGGTGITYQTERRCACQPDPPQGDVVAPGDLEEALRLAEVGEFLYNACAYKYGDGYTEPREYGIEWQWQQRQPDEYGQGQLLAASTKWHTEQAEDGTVTEAAKLRAALASVAPSGAEPVAWLVTWKRDGKEWVNAHANEVTAIDEARRWKGIVTPLYTTPAPQEVPAEDIEGRLLEHSNTAPAFVDRHWQEVARGLLNEAAATIEMLGGRKMTCSVAGCGQRVHGYGLCGKHYWCWKKNGAVQAAMESASRRAASRALSEREGQE